MNILRPSIYAVALTSLALSNAIAQTTATTDPVGFVSFTVNANSDQKLGLPMQQASVFSGTASGVSGTTVNASGLTTLSGANFLLVTSGSAAGKWEQVLSSSAGSLTLERSIGGFAAQDSFTVKPFWTLGTLFPSGSTIPKSTDVFSPVAEVLMNNPSATGVNIAASSAYFYFAGDADYPAGWYDSSNPDDGIKNNVLLSPDVLFTLRNGTASSFSVSMVGSVPVDQFALEINSRPAGPQDNLVYNLFPADVTLQNSGLAPAAITPSGDIFSPGDQLLVYPLANTGFNSAPTVAYFYFGGDADYPAGWYDASNPDDGLKNTVVLPVGTGFVVRKSTGSTAAIWNPAPPYSLD
jgi:uncharacterized protein (TIGR02597 family)